MSERQPFDPLAEARMNADPQRQRFYEVVGSDADANRDYAAYLETRDFKDENGVTHDASTGRFTTVGSEDTYDADLLESARDEAYSMDAAHEGLKSLSLNELAQTVAHLREKGDFDGSHEVESAFFDKFSDMSEKYGWEKEVMEDGEESRVEKDVPLGRDTVDARLERFTKIMYADADSAEKQAEKDPESSDAKESETDTATYDSDSSTDTPEATGQKDDSQEVSDDKKDEDNVPALNFGSETPTSVVASEGTRSVLIPRLNFDQVVADDAASERAAADKEDKEAPENNQEAARKGWKGLLDRTRTRVTVMAGNTLVGSRDVLSRGYNKLRSAQEKEDSKETKTKKRVLIGLGVVATGVAIGLLMDQASKRGFDVGAFDFTPPADGSELSTADLTTDTQAATTETVEVPVSGGYDFSEAAQTIGNGEGWNQTMRELGIPASEWGSILNEAGPELVSDGSAYYDNVAGEYRMHLGDGELSGKSLTRLADLAKARGITIG